TVLNYLQVCDNPYQDIPLAGVLHSPIVGCTAQEMAMLRSEFPEGMLYESLLDFVEDGQITVFMEDARELLKEKLKKFLVQLEEFRNMAGYTPVHQLILQILDRTGYGNYAGAMPGGEQRSANLNMLVEKAMEYEKTSYRGLFHFVRYIEQLKKYEVDYGEVNLTGSETGAVQIMTIHKSKGLEFPVVIVAGMGKQFNFQDMNAGLLIHPELGLGADAILPEKRLKVSTLTKQVIRRELQKESLGEELRVLYVALTRAKEKLIMTGSVSKLEKTLLSMKRFRGREMQILPLGYRLKAKDFLSYVLPALINHPELEEMLSRYNLLDDVRKTVPEWNDTSGVSFQVHIVQPMEMMQEEVQRQTSEMLQKELLENRDETKVYDEEIRNEIQKRFSYVYPWMLLREIPAKVSVSDLKKHRFETEEEQEAAPILALESAKEAYVPQFMEQKKENASGSARGTAYHRVMECLDYEKLVPALSFSDDEVCEAVGRQIRHMIKAGKLSQVQADCIREMDICRFLRSSLGGRMRQAALQGVLKREQPFVYSVPASALNPVWPEQETVLVQGIIDAYYIEEKELVLVDYKTDNVPDVEKLRELYQVQLHNYVQALERLTGMKVKECYIYSFKFHKEILL
ncbi:MAG: PD-(D/E)XK nuclease family protein, partial [Blautia sp.]|nr:PD-(D/E)XK nuclease family protein [Blautia sp.]